jgi:hypothetical protein
MKNKNTWTPEKAREMAKKSAMIRKMKKDNLAYLGLGSQNNHGEPIVRLTAFPSPNFAMPREIIKEQWIKSIRISIALGILFGFILTAIDRLL